MVTNYVHRYYLNFLHFEFNIMRELCFILILMSLSSFNLTAQVDSMDICPDFRKIIDIEYLLETATEKIEKTFKNQRVLDARRDNALGMLEKLDYTYFNKCIEMFAQQASCEEIKGLTLFQFYLFDSDLYRFYLVIYTNDSLDYYYYGDLFTGEIEFKGIRSGMHLYNLLRFYLESTTASINDSHYLYLNYRSGSTRMGFSPKFSLIDLNVIAILMDALLNPSVERK